MGLPRKMSRRYLTWAALGYLCGICVCWQKNWQSVLTFLLLALYLCWGLRKAKSKKLLPVMVLVFVGMALAGGVHYNQQIKEKEHLLSLMSDGDALTIQGEVYKKEAKEKTNLIYLEHCYLNYRDRNDQKHQIQKAANILVYSDKLSYSMGNILLVEGTLKAFSVPTNEGGFNEKQYYESQKITMKVMADTITVANDRENVVKEGLYRLKLRIMQIYQTCLPKKEAGIIGVVALGEKSEMDREMKELYRDGGISHILSISGLHISLVGMFLFQLLRKRKVSFWTSALTALLFCLGFGLMSGMSISSKRAILMFALYLLAQVTGYAYDSLTALAAALLCMLWENPFLVENSGFQFSFAAVASAALVYPALKTNVKWQQSFLLCFSIQVVTLPATLWYYYEVPLFTIGINLFVLPFMGILLGFSLVGGVVGLGSMPLAWGLLRPVQWILQFYEWILRMEQRIPGAIRITGQPESWKLGVYYGMVLFLFFRFGRSEKRREEEESETKKTKERRQRETARRRIGVLAALSFCMIGLCFWPQKQQFEVDVLDVGQGDGIYLQSESGKRIFMDGGSSSVSQVGTYRILPFLKAKGIRQIDYWFVSHTDADHISGLLEILASDYLVKHLILAKDRVVGENETELIQAAERADCKILFMKAGQRIQMEKSEKITCLFPETEFKGTDLNARSMVLWFESGSFTGLFGGDMNQDSERYLVEKELVDQVDFYKASHHGSATSNSEILLRKIVPRITVASAGEKNRYGHPAPEAVERIRDCGSQFCDTIECGRVRITRKANRLILEKYRKPLATEVFSVID